jgi:osmotically-inducible protein OsmY
MGAKVTDGVAHLTGWVDNPNQEKTAIHLANSVEGVKDVFSELKMRRSGPSDDVTIHNDVMQMLNQADDLDSMYIDLSVEEAEVTLLGEVPNTTQYSRAEELAGSVPGVRKIHNRLTITGVS